MHALQPAPWRSFLRAVLGDLTSDFTMDFTMEFDWTFAPFEGGWQSFYRKMIECMLLALAIVELVAMLSICLNCN